MEKGDDSAAQQVSAVSAATTLLLLRSLLLLAPQPNAFVPTAFFRCVWRHHEIFFCVSFVSF